MNWNKIVIEAVENFFAVMDKSLDKKGIDKVIRINPKGDVTYKIDETTQKAYQDILPNVTIVSEEAIIKMDSDFIVFLDPVCGSVFARRGSEQFTTGIAVYDKKLRPVCEAIGLFDTKDIYHANNNGAFKNRKKIHVSGTKKLEDSTINFESHKPPERTTIMKTALFRKAPHMFSPWSVKYSLARLAEGHIDGFVNCANTYPISELIGIFIIEKAGGIVSDKNGNRIKIYPDLKHKTTLLCSCTKELHKAILKNL